LTYANLTTESPRLI